MNDDMSNMLNQFSEILKEKNINLNQILSNQGTNNNNESSNESQTSSNSSSNGMDFDIDTILKIKDILQVMNQKNTPRNNLLQSLKPFLREEKQEKLEQYIKYANILNLLELFNKERRV